MPERSWLDNPTRQMFAVGFAVLFFELFAIRWFPAHIRHLGYFTNFVLLAAFLGLGAGTLLGHRKGSLLHLFPASLTTVVALVWSVKLEMTISTPEVIYFQNSQPDATATEPLLLLPFLFVVLVWLFTVLSTPLGPLFASLPPLSAYRANLWGSLAGIVGFTFLSGLHLGPVVWMVVVAVSVYLLLPEEKKSAVSIVLLMVGCLLVAMLDYAYIWSPYYKIEEKPLIHQGRELGHNILVNNTGHQMLIPSQLVDGEPMYAELYRALPGKELDNVLIIGAGGGRDTAYALRQGVDQVDAVEIDPVLLQFGFELHPERPYFNPQVTVYNQDGRTFLARSQKKYDAVIFALPDSLVLASSHANLRLESYLFTVESFQDVKRLLKPDGVFVLYNGYRKLWLVEKLAGMVEQVFGQAPTITHYQDNTTCLLAGPGAAELEPTTFEQHPPATDDWPFLYLAKPSFPALFGWSILVVLATTLVVLTLVGRPRAILEQPLFFLLGTAFMLLETRSVTCFALLFGSTWYVNAVVFSVILLLVVAAVELNSRFQLSRGWLYSGLLMTLILNYLLSPHVFLANDLARAVLAPIFYLLPIFFANLAFTRDFKVSDQAQDAYAANMVGAVCGGLAEYSSMVLGYSNLLLIALVLYLIAWALTVRSAQ